MPTFKITVAYDGTDYVGWQRQATGTSIQGVIEEALLAFGDGAVAVAGAGRTDAGVHALGQVASFALQRELPCDAIVRALNARLPAEIRVLAAAHVPASFHARFDARTKTYRYRIWNGDVMPPFERRYALHLPGRLDVEAMRRAARLIEGEHDFAAFQSGGSDVATSVRKVSISRIAECGLRSDCGLGSDGLRSDCGLGEDEATIPNNSAFRNPQSRNESALRTPQSALLVYDVTGNGFLRHMVRSIVGTLVEIGRGRQPVDWLTDVLESRSRASAGQTAPALGLFLARVSYGDADHEEGARGTGAIGFP